MMQIDTSENAWKHEDYSLNTARPKVVGLIMYF